MSKHRVAVLKVEAKQLSVTHAAAQYALGTHLIEPDRKYWRNQRRDPGRWPRYRACPEGSERVVQTLHVEGVEELAHALVAA
jgi:hypothetical protein